MEWTVSFTIPVLLAIAGLGFFCALAETALFSLGRWQLQQWREGTGATSLAARLMERPEELLSALTMANTVANGMVVVTSLRLAASLGWNFWWTLAGAFFAVLVLGEILPKTLAVRSPERWAVRVAPAVALLQWITRPLCAVAKLAVEKSMEWLLPRTVRPPQITDDEYRELLDMAVQQGALGSSQREIIAGFITLDRKQARDVMRPRATMAAVADDLSTEELLAAARKFRRRRLPVYDETPDTIVAVLDTHQLLLDPEHRLDEALEFPSFVPETINLLKLFKALQQQKRSIAIVLDEFGAVAGVVRMEDILAEVLGDMSGGAAPRALVFERLGLGRWRVSGATHLDDFRREYPDLPEMPDIETLGGLLMSELDIVPQRGESATIHGLRLTAEVVDERQIHELMVERTTSR